MRKSSGQDMPEIVTGHGATPVIGHQEAEVFEALRVASAALCQAESEKLETPNVQTAGFTYFRLRKQGYSPKERAELAKQAVELAQKGDVFTYFKHEDTPEGALYAEELLAAAKQAETARAKMAP